LLTPPGAFRTQVSDLRRAIHHCSKLLPAGSTCDDDAQKMYESDDGYEVDLQPEHEPVREAYLEPVRRRNLIASTSTDTARSGRMTASASGGYLVRDGPGYCP